MEEKTLKDYFIQILKRYEMPTTGTQSFIDASNLPEIAAHLEDFLLTRKPPSGPWSDLTIVPKSFLHADGYIAPISHEDGTLHAGPLFQIDSMKAAADNAYLLLSVEVNEREFLSAEGVKQHTAELQKRLDEAETLLQIYHTDLADRLNRLKQQTRELQFVNRQVEAIVKPYRDAKIS